MEALAADPRLVPGQDERFNGYGVMGVPHGSRHYLVLRVMLASSVGPAYRAVWHRDPGGRWTIHTTTDPRLSCPRYFGSVDDADRVDDIAVRWRDDWHLEVTMDARLHWRLRLAASPATTMMSAMGGATPDWAWDSTVVLTGMGPMASGVLGSGRIRLLGATPNGPRFRAAPLQVWRVAESTALLDGHDLGVPAPLPQQTRLGDFWLPQRGLFFVGRARFSTELAADRPGDAVGARS